MIIDTKILTDPIFKEGYGMSKLEAFVWILDNSDKEGKLYFSNKTYSIVFGWHRNKVSRFFEELALLGYVGIVHGHTNNCISITCNGSCAGYVGIVKSHENKPKNQPTQESKLLFDQEPEKEQKQPKKAPKSPKKESNSLYPKMMKVYHDWFSERNDGLPPNINMQEGASLKKIIAYFEPLVIKKAATNGIIIEKGSEEANNEVVNAFSLIFNQWDKMDSFIQSGVKLSQINSNLTNIINTIKNGNAKPPKQDKRQEAIERNKRTLEELIGKYTAESEAGN
jgi:hypothetical protein